MTDEQERFITENWNKMSAESLRKKFNETYGTQLKTTAFHYHTKRLGLVKYIMHRYTDEQDDFLHINSDKMTRDELTDTFNKKFGTNINVQAIIQRCYLKGFKPQTDGKYKKGSVPWEKSKGGRTEYLKKLKGGNTTSFKKGLIPHNTRDIGSIRIHRRVVMVKTPNGWKNRLRYLWEQNYGDIPDGYAVISVNGDMYTNNPSDLRAIPNRILTILMSNRWTDCGQEIIDCGITWGKLKILLETQTALYDFIGEKDGND